MLITKRTLHRIGEHRITFGIGAAGLEFRIADQGGGFITGSYDGKEFIGIERGTSGPDSYPSFSPQRRDALAKALAEREAGKGTVIDDREQS